jgi:hypothetical protein
MTDGYPAMMPEDFDMDESCPNCCGEGIVPGCMVDFCDCGGEDDADLCCAPRRCDWCKPAALPQVKP